MLRTEISCWKPTLSSRKLLLSTRLPTVRLSFRRALALCLVGFACEALRQTVQQVVQSCTLIRCTCVLIDGQCV